MRRLANAARFRYARRVLGTDAASTGPAPRLDETHTVPRTGQGVVGAIEEASTGGAAFGLAATSVGRSSHGPPDPLQNTFQGILWGLTAA